MVKQSVSTKPIPPTMPATRSDREPVEGRVLGAPVGRPRIHDATAHTARPTPSLPSKPFDWGAD